MRYATAICPPATLSVLCGALALLGAACGAGNSEPAIPRPISPSAASTTPSQPATGERAVPAKPFGLTVDEYWTNPWKNLGDLSWKIIEDEVSGILIDCPEMVAGNARPTIPLLVFVSGENGAIASAPFMENAVIAAIELDSNELRAAGAFTIDTSEPRSHRPPPAGFTGAEFKIDLVSRGVLGQAPGRYLITVVSRDRVSNRVPLRLGPVSGHYKDEEVEKFLHERRAQLPPSPVEPEESEPTVRYGDGAGCPPTPATPGIALSADRVVVSEPGAKGYLHGSFRLPALTNDLIKNADKHPGLKPKAGRPAATAVVPISLLIVGAETGGAEVLRVQAPSFTKVLGDQDAPIATGFFRLDLLGTSVLGKPQTYFIYAFSGESMAGPVPMALVAKEQVPAR